MNGVITCFVNIEGDSNELQILAKELQNSPPDVNYFENIKPLNDQIFPLIQKLPNLTVTISASHDIDPAMDGKNTLKLFVYHAEIKGNAVQLCGFIRLQDHWGRLKSNLPIKN